MFRRSEKQTFFIWKPSKDYTRIVTLERKHCILDSLGNLLHKNFFDSFVRIHRSYAVPKHLIRGKSCHEIELIHHIKLPIGRTYKNNLSFLSLKKPFNFNNNSQNAVGLFLPLVYFSDTK
jgi:hypothetical protein